MFLHPKYPSPNVIFIGFNNLTKCRVYHLALKPAQYALCGHEGVGGYEAPPKQLFMPYLTAKKLV